MPRVSICMPAYNAAAFLPATLESVWAQDFTDFEIVIVDDCSTDDTPAIIAAQRDPRLRAFRHEPNRGQGATVDAAIYRATGEYIKFLDSDDLLDPTCLSRMVAALDAHPSASMVFSRRTVIVDDDKEPDVARAWLAEHGELQRRFVGLQTVNDGHELLSQWVAAGLDSNWIAEPAGVMARRDRLAEAGGYSQRVRLVTDMDLWARLMTCGDVVYLDEQLYTYRLTAGGVTGTAIAVAKEWLDWLWIAEGLLAMPGGDDIPLLAQMRGRLARRAARMLASNLVRRPPGTVGHVRDFAAYARYRAAVAVGRRPPIYERPLTMSETPAP